MKRRSFIQFAAMAGAEFGMLTMAGASSSNLINQPNPNPEPDASLINGLNPLLNAQSDEDLNPLVLDLPEAKRLAFIGELVSSSLIGGYKFASLDRYTKVFPEAIQYLSKYADCEVVYMGIHNLNLDLAKSFESIQNLDLIRFDLLKTLSALCAKTLSSTGADLRFLDLHVLSNATAKELAKSKGWLDVTLRKNVSTEVICELSMHQGRTNLWLNTELSHEAARCIAENHASEFWLGGSQNKPSAALISTLTSNPNKRVTVYFNNRYPEEHYLIAICDPITSTNLQYLT